MHLRVRTLLDAVALVVACYAMQSVLTLELPVLRAWLPDSLLMALTVIGRQLKDFLFNF